MNQICPKCNAPLEGPGRFCSQCGHVLGATDTGSNTVALQPTQVAGPPINVQTIVQRTQQAYGSSNIQMPTSAGPSANSNQREHVFTVMDISGSMASRYDSHYSKIEAAGRANGTMAVNKAQIDPNDQIGLITFNHKAQIILPLAPLATCKRQFLMTLQSLQASGGTDQNKGLVTAEMAFDWSISDVVRRIIMLTDGQGGEPLNTAERLKAQGVVIDVIGVGDRPNHVNEKLLRKVASVIEGESRYRFIKDQQTLVAHYTQLANKTATV